MFGNIFIIDIGWIFGTDVIVAEHHRKAGQSGREPTSMSQQPGAGRREFLLI